MAYETAINSNLQELSKGAPFNAELGLLIVQVYWLPTQIA